MTPRYMIQDTYWPLEEAHEYLSKKKKLMLIQESWKVKQIIEKTRWHNNFNMQKTFNIYFNSKKKKKQMKYVQWLSMILKNYLNVN